MASTKISNMPLATNLDGTEVFAIVQSGGDFKASLTLIYNSLDLLGLIPNAPITYVANPNTEGLTPRNIALPATAYSQDGTGSMYGWNTSTHVWQ